MPEFEAFPKIARLNRGMVISEKIDGTNASARSMFKVTLKNDALPKSVAEKVAA